MTKVTHADVTLRIISEEKQSHGIDREKIEFTIYSKYNEEREVDVEWLCFYFERLKIRSLNELTLRLTL